MLVEAPFGARRAGTFSQQVCTVLMDSARLISVKSSSSWQLP